jgi:general stress protein 26
MSADTHTPDPRPESIDTVRSIMKDVRTYAGSSSWLSLTGSAAVVDDAEKKKELWNTFIEARFPDGQDDPSVVVVKVDGGSAQYWESPGRLAMTLDMVKARVTGNPPKSGDTGTVVLEGAS